jgi:hypothetical protein
MGMEASPEVSATPALRMAGPVLMAQMAVTSTRTIASDEPRSLPHGPTKEACVSWRGLASDSRARSSEQSRMMSMSGAFIMVFVLVIGFPLTVMASGSVLAVILGQSLWRDGEDRHPGSELVELNR